MAEVAAGFGYNAQSTADAVFGWSDAAPPRSVRVRWPDGTETMRPVSAADGATTLLITAP
jgi:hypothetical protein